MNFGMILRRAARNFPDKAAVQFDDRQLTWRRRCRTPPC
jgi:hypothetical protein